MAAAHQCNSAAVLIIGKEPGWWTVFTMQIKMRGEKRMNVIFFKKNRRVIKRSWFSFNIG